MACFLSSEKRFTKTVTGICVNSSNSVTGVVTSDGYEIKTKLILSNATPKITLGLLPRNTVDNKYFNAIQTADYSSPVTKINVALSKLPSFTADKSNGDGVAMPHHQATIHINCENCSLLDEAHDSASKGSVPLHPMIEMVIPSSLDPTIAPKGAHVCLLFTQFTPYYLSDGRSWSEEKKEQYAKNVFNLIEEYAPGFKNSIIDKEVLPPNDLERIFGLTGGNIFHGSLKLNQMFISRPVGVHSCHSPETPINGLLMCGAGAHPGGGVTGSPGRLAALHALQYIL